MNLDVDLNNVKFMPKMKMPSKTNKRAPRKGRVKQRDTYHHGDLHTVLVRAAEAIILERGVEGFTLREAARRAGVSPAAPAHHFGDARGLLSEVALLGFRDFAEVLHDADKKAGKDPGRRLYEQGIAYVDFAMRNPARFQLMFRGDEIDPSYKNLGAVAEESFQTLENAIRALVQEEDNGELSPEGYGALMATWSLVHGFSHLALAGEFDRAASTRGGRAAILSSFLPLALRYLPDPKAARMVRQR